MSSKHLDPKQMAEELGVSVDQAKKLITKGHIPAVNVGLGERIFWRVSREDFDAWKDRKRAETARSYGGAA